jgi:hypothetical protein
MPSYYIWILLVHRKVMSKKLVKTPRETVAKRRRKCYRGATSKPIENLSKLREFVEIDTFIEGICITVGENCVWFEIGRCAE